MNRERVKELIDIINQSKSFNMAEFFHGCGSPSCIAGHAVFKWRPEIYYTPHHSALGTFGYGAAAGELLGIENWRALFIPECIIEWSEHEFDNDRGLAIQALENLLDGAYTEAELWPVPYAAYQEWLQDAQDQG